MHIKSERTKTTYVNGDYSYIVTIEDESLVDLMIMQGNTIIMRVDNIDELEGIYDGMKEILEQIKK